MKILMLNNEFPPLGGGTGIVNFHLLEELASYKDVWIDLITSSRTKYKNEKKQFAERIWIYKVPINNKNIHHSTNVELIRYLIRGLLLCRQMHETNQYDLSFSFAGLPAGIISYTLHTFDRLPYILSLQGPDVPGFEARYDYLYPFLKPIIRMVWSKASVVTAISKNHKRLASMTMPDLDIPIIVNGVDTRFFSPSTGTKKENQEITIVCVGRLIERKGQHHLLKAFARLCETLSCPLQLVLVGKGDSEKLLKELVKELDLNEKVKFTGYVDQKDMPTVYRNADIFVLPSQNEGMSIALLEGMASGLPVVVTYTGGTEELVRNGHNGFVVNWGDVLGLFQVLSDLINNIRLRKFMGTVNREIAEEHNWERFTREYYNLCNHIMAKTINRPTITQKIPSR